MGRARAWPQAVPICSRSPTTATAWTLPTCLEVLLRRGACMPWHRREVFHLWVGCSVLSCHPRKRRPDRLCLDASDRFLPRRCSSLQPTMQRPIPCAVGVNLTIVDRGEEPTDCGGGLGHVCTGGGTSHMSIVATATHQDVDSGRGSRVLRQAGPRIVTTPDLCLSGATPRSYLLAHWSAIVGLTPLSDLHAPIATGVQLQGDSERSARGCRRHGCQMIRPVPSPSGA